MPVLLAGVLWMLQAMSLFVYDAGTAPSLVIVVAWVALAAFTWNHGRVALFFLVVLSCVVPATYVGLKFGESPCGIRPPDPRVVSREDEFKALPVPHFVCDLQMVDGSHQYDGAPPREFFIALGWVALATALLLSRRPGWIARGILVVVTWLAATFALFW